MSPSDAGSDGGVDRGRIRYDSDNTVHVQVGGDDSEVVFTERGERHKVLCGAVLPGRGMEIDGMRLFEEHQNGNVCETCLNRLQERESTIPGFISEGEVVACA